MPPQLVKNRVGLEADRPNGARNIGAQYVATDTGRTYEWNGAAWIDITDVNFITLTIGQPVPAGTPAGTVIIWIAP